MNNRIDLDRTYHIDIDDHNWILKKSVPTQEMRKGGQPSDNAGKMHDNILGYYPSLEIALRHYVDHLEKDGVLEVSDPISIATLQTILLNIEKVCKGLKLVETEKT